MNDVFREKRLNQVYPCDSNTRISRWNRLKKTIRLSTSRYGFDVLIDSYQSVKDCTLFRSGYLHFIENVNGPNAFVDIPTNSFPMFAQNARLFLPIRKNTCVFLHSFITFTIWFIPLLVRMWSAWNNSVGTIVQYYVLLQWRGVRFSNGEAIKPFIQCADIMNPGWMINNHLLLNFP